MTSHLARIPVELFITICEVVHEAGEGPYLARIARAFVPVGRRLAFRKVEVKKRAHHEQLCEVVEACPFIGSCMVDLELVMPVEEDAAVPPSRADLLSFFQRLVKIKTLVLEHLPAASGLILSVVHGQAPVLLSLVELTIQGAPEGSASLFDPNNFHGLRQYTHLVSLDLSTIAPDPAGQPTPPVQALAPIRNLGLFGHLCGNAAALSLLSSFESVADLTICDTSPGRTSPDLSPLLDAVQAPALVKGLMLVQQHRGRLVAADSLEHFGAVEQIKIGFHLWSPALIPSFASLRHLKDLALLACVDLSIADLQALLADKDLIMHLKHVQIEPGPGYDEDPSASSALLPFEGLAKLFETATTIGVMLYGTYMDPVYMACERFLEEREQERDAAQEAAGARVGAAAGAAPEEGATSASGTGEGQSET